MRLAFIFLLLARMAAAGPVWKTDLTATLKDAAQRKKLVLVDFQAPWCYSCYYMEKHVLSSERFEQAALPLLLVKLDVDSEDGRALREKYAVAMLPSYLLLDAKGREKGRIVGEQRENDFVERLVGLQQGASQDDAARAALRAKIKKGDLDSLEKALGLPADCETAYDIDYGNEHLGTAAQARQMKILTAERTALELLARQRLFVDPPKRCADFRTGVEDLASVYEKLGLAQERKALLSRAAETMLAQGKTGEDRNRDDNVRFFLTLLDDQPRLRSFYKELIASYPSDYVYAWRYAKWLEEHQDAQGALPWIEEADKLCYGANRLKVTETRARILADLGRKDEAKALLKRDAKAGRRNFPREAADLEALFKSL